MSLLPSQVPSRAASDRAQSMIISRLPGDQVALCPPRNANGPGRLMRRPRPNSSPCLCSSNTSRAARTARLVRSTTDRSATCAQANALECSLSAAQYRPVQPPSPTATPMLRPSCQNPRSKPQDHAPHMLLHRMVALRYMPKPCHKTPKAKNKTLRSATRHNPPSLGMRFVCCYRPARTDRPGLMHPSTDGPMPDTARLNAQVVAPPLLRNDMKAHGPESMALGLKPNTETPGLRPMPLTLSQCPALPSGATRKTPQSPMRHMDNERCLSHATGSSSTCSHRSTRGRPRRH